MSEAIQNGKLSKAIRIYSETIFKHSGKFLLAMILISGVVASQSSNVETVEQQVDDFLPGSKPVIKSFNILEAEFPSSGGTKYTILIETDPDHPNSNEIRDVRNPEFLRYIDLLTSEMKSLNKINSVRGPSDLFKEIPSDKSSVISSMTVLGEGRWSQHISDDFQAVKIEASSRGLNSEEQTEVANSIRNIIESNEKSSDFKVGYTGQIYIDQAFQNQSQQTMGTTSTASLLGVMLIVIIFFRSIYYGLNSLLTVVFGVAVGFGVYGLLGFNITPQTSGAISLGIGIAIDFGIQPIARYIEERKNMEIKEALQETFNGVLTPMTVGLFAANIGFLALAVGKLTFLKDLGILLTLTTTVAYISAFTVIPSAMVFYDRYLTGGSTNMDLSKLYYKVKQQ